MIKVVFFGSSPLSNIVLDKLVSSDQCSVVSVVTKEDKPVGRHLEMVPNPVKVIAEKNNIPVITSLNQLSLDISDTVGLVAAYGKIIPQNVLDTFGGQIYNIHPSLLPKYRGASPLQSQILDGATETGVTIIQLDAEMDHGPIVAQSKSILMPDETWLSLGQRLFAEGADLFINSPTLLRPPSLKTREGLGVSYRAQDHTQATYTKKITRQDGFVAWEEFNPQKLGKKLRAYANWPGVWTLMPDGKRLKLISISPEISVQIEGKSPQPWTPGL